MKRPFVQRVHLDRAWSRDDPVGFSTVWTTVGDGSQEPNLLAVFFMPVSPRWGWRLLHRFSPSRHLPLLAPVPLVGLSLRATISVDDGHPAFEGEHARAVVR